MQTRKMTQTIVGGITTDGYPQNPYLFKGGIQDRASGLVKFGQRWYSPTTGTWTKQDTLDAPLDLTNGNRYAYAGDDPINNMDPGGQSCDLTTAINNAAGAGGLGAILGGGIGFVLGSIVPGAGTAAGTLAGGAIGGLAGADISLISSLAQC
jgi:RHS repeat-associated protein